jgi:hypothetical protein
MSPFFFSFFLFFFLFFFFFLLSLLLLFLFQHSRVLNVFRCWVENYSSDFEDEAEEPLIDFINLLESKGGQECEWGKFVHWVVCCCCCFFFFFFFFFFFHSSAHTPHNSTLPSLSCSFFSLFFSKNKKTKQIQATRKTELLRTPRWLCPTPIIPSNLASSAPIIFLKVHPLEIARQLTLMEFKLFKAIRLKEYQQTAWGRDPESTPNVQAFIRRFNQVSFLYPSLSPNPPPHTSNSLIKKKKR